MSTHEVLSNLLGVSGEPRVPVIEALRARGIVVHPSSIPNWRSGNRNGNELAFRLNAGLLLDEPNSIHKVDYYSKIGEIGLDLRYPQKTHPHRYFSYHFAERIAASLGIDSLALRHCLRAIRVDVCYREEDRPREINETARRLFVPLARQFLDDYTTPQNSHTSTPVLRIKKAWGGKTIEDFYRKLYENAVKTTISAWEPYEVGFIYGYYKTPELVTEPSDFDKIALLSSKRIRTIIENAALVRVSTGIPIDYEVVATHAKVLINGSPN